MWQLGQAWIGFIVLYLGIVAAIGIAAFKQRGQGWRSGALLALMLLTLPLWVAGLCLLFKLFFAN